MITAQDLKKDFPILNREINGHPLAYLDNAATTQKPQSVINSVTNYYQNHNANIHRGIHKLSEEATEAYESARTTIAKFINAKSEREIIFTRNATEAINIVAQTWARQNIKAGDQIIVSSLEHHSNLVVWQELCAELQADLKVIPITADLTLDIDAYKKILDNKTKLVAFTGCSNVTGTITPIKQIIDLAHQAGAMTLLDGAQSVAHMPTDVQELNCDFLAFSAHKMLGPTGIGILYGKQSLLESMPPFLFGGDMIHVVHQFESEYNELPHKFEAGTPNIAGAIAFHEAIKYLSNVGMEQILKHDQELLTYAKEKFSQHPAIKIYSPSNPQDCSGILSFTVDGMHPHDIASIFDNEGVAIRSGHHCAQPLMENLGIPATARLSFYLYNSTEDIDRAEQALLKGIKLFGIK